MKRNIRRPAGFAMLIVMVFIALLLSMASVCYRGLASALRVEKVETQIRTRDEGVVRAVAEATALLESGTPDESPFVCGIHIETSAGRRDFVVTYTSHGGGVWSIEARPAEATDIVTPMPESFIP